MPYKDYPQAATDNAAKALKHREEHNSKCGTPVGWRTAQILASKSVVTKQRLPRIFSFLSRAKTYDQGKFFNEDGNEICGSVMYAAWGGDEMLRWAKRTLDDLENDRAISDLSATARKGLENKVEEHNEEYGDTKTKRVTLGMLTKVYERGVGAYHTNPESVRPNVTGPEMWAMARVNSFLYAVRNERFRSGKHDTDLFPDGHPLKTKEEMKQLRLSMLINEEIAIIDDRLAYSTQEKAEEIAEDMGLEGFHTHEFMDKTWYMAGETHDFRYHHEEEEEERVSFDFDGTLNNDVGRAYLEEEKNKGSEIYIISARENDEYLQGFAIANGIDKERVFAMGNDESKIAKIQELNISRHYDNNSSVVESVRGILVQERAEPDELSVGDFVRWMTSGGNAYGRIIQVENNGELEADSGFVLNGTMDDPAALIRLFRYSNDEDAYIERKPVLNVVHPFSRLEIFDAEVRKSSVVIESRDYHMESMEQNGNVVRGYAAVYDSDSEFMGYYEQIEKGAFDDVLNDDVRAYYNHDENYLLGRVSSGTLRIGTDKRGLFYEVDLPKTSYANDLVELMKRGDINQSSFAFLIGEDRWEQRDGKTYRIISKISRLIDVSPVAMPAYQMATSELKRDLETETPPIESAPTDGVDSDSKDGEEVSNIYLYKSKLLNF